jgi:hypothetical protein
MSHEAMSGANTSDTLNINYDEFRNIISNSYTKKDIGNVTYYLNELNQVVARKEDNVLNLYFNQIYNSNINIPICMVIIKDFILKMGMFSHKKSDVIFTGKLKYDEWAVVGLNKGYNTFSHANRMKVIRVYDDYITIDPDILLNFINSMDYFIEEVIDEILPILYQIKEQLKTAKKLQIGSISTINHNINPNDKHVSLFNIPGYSLILHDYVTYYDQPCCMFGQNFYVLNEKIKLNSDVTITPDYLNNHNYAKLLKPTIKRVN